MTSKDEQRNIKAIWRLQQRSSTIAGAHDDIHRDIRAIKAKLPELGDVDKSTPDFAERKQAHLDAMSEHKELPDVDLEAIYNEAETEFPRNANLDDILTSNDWAVVDKRVAARIEVFNARYALDGWDYAIAGGCGLFAAMLDLLFVRAPTKPTTKWTKEMDGVFNRGVQKAFSRLLPPDVSKELGRLSTIGGADSSTVDRLLGTPPRTLNPMNHRLRSLSHDPILGFLFGVLDMRRGTCTVVGNDGLKIYPTMEPVEGSLFPLLGRVFGHLLSDVHARSANDNRGMGLPAPFMGVLRMFDSLPVGDSDLGKQIEYMYFKGYDFRQFIVTSIPMLIMEVMMRVFLRRQTGEAHRIAAGGSSGRHNADEDEPPIQDDARYGLWNGGSGEWGQGISHQRYSQSELRGVARAYMEQFSCHQMGAVGQVPEALGRSRTGGD